jgi:16S rRNA (guanine527-N7)-methyltransferase
MGAGAEIVFKYFPELSAEQRERFSRLGALYAEWNTRVNLVSRKDIEQLYERHVLHSLGIARVAAFKPGMTVIDVGTGGGFPGIPLAILFPEVRFHLIDGIGKKITAVNGIISALGLKNATAEQLRSEDHRVRYDAVVSRAVTALPDFLRSTRHLLSAGGSIFYLKGGELEEELRSLKQRARVFDLSDHFEGEFFGTKKVVRIDP